MKYIVVVMCISSTAYANEDLQEIRRQGEIYCLDYTSIHCQAHLSTLRLTGIRYKEPVFLMFEGMLRQNNKDLKGAIEAYELAIPMIPTAKDRAVVRAEIKKLQDIILRQRVVNKGRRLLQDFDNWLDE